MIADDDHLRQISEDLDDAKIAHTWAARSLGQPVTLVPATSANGLEFDHVIVVEPGMLYRSDPIVGPRLLYVALTRARETLTLLHRERLPSVLSLVDEPTEKPHTTAPHGPTDPTPEPPAPTGPAAVPAVAPAREADAGWSWFSPLPGGDGLHRVSLAGEVARVERVPLSGGAGHVVATGYALSDAATIFWLLRKSDGSVVSVRTNEDPEAATGLVLAAITGEQH